MINKDNALLAACHAALWSMDAFEMNVIPGSICRGVYDGFFMGVRDQITDAVKVCDELRSPKDVLRELSCLLDAPGVDVIVSGGIGWTRDATVKIRSLLDEAKQLTTCE